jgi:hypothetical protein
MHTELSLTEKDRRIFVDYLTLDVSFVVRP